MRGRYLTDPDRDRDRDRRPAEPAGCFIIPLANSKSNFKSEVTFTFRKGIRIAIAIRGGKVERCGAAGLAL